MTMHSEQRGRSRRSFIKGAGLGVLGATVLSSAPEAFGKGSLTRGDAASCGSWRRPRSSRPIFGSSTTSCAASRTTRCPAAVATTPSLRP